MSEETGSTVPTDSEIIRGLRLLPIRVTRASGPDVPDETVTDLQMDWCDNETGASFSLTFSNGTTAFVKIVDSIDVTPPEMSHLLYELSDFINAQLFVQKHELRLLGTEHWWIENAALQIQHRSRQSISTSVWEKLLTDSSYQPLSTITRIVKTEPPVL